MERARLRFTHLLEWPERDKATLLAVLTLPLVFLHGAWVWLTDNLTPFGPAFLSESGVRFTYLLTTYTFLCWVLLSITGMILQRLDRQGTWFVLLTLVCYGPSLIGLGYTIGLMSPITGVILLGATLVGFVLFDFWRVLAIFLFNIAVIALVSWLTVNGTLEYAPALARDPVSKSEVSAYWVASQFTFGLPYVVVAFSIIYMLLTRWRAREAQTIQMAMTDPLTRVANRRSILDALGRELARQQRDKTSLSVVLLDLDHFKSVNDTWGHAVGDNVLVATAAVLKEQLREADWVGRYGGEEFVLILPGADSRAAEQAIERCREAISRQRIQTSADHILKITASFGVFCVPGNAPCSADDALKRADTALYTAKEQGRNRVCLWSPTLDV